MTTASNSKTVMVTTDTPFKKILEMECPEGMKEAEKLVYLAKLAEQAERYDEMVQFMHSRSVMAESELTLEERNLLSVGYKNAVGSRRGSLRIAACVKSKAERKVQSPEGSGTLANAQLQLATEYEANVIKELDGICHQLLRLVDEYLLKISGNSKEAIIFYWKMKGDYLRYLSEYAPSERTELTENAKLSYDKATELAEAHLCPTNPIRLGLALNYSVHSFEIVNDAEEACRMAQKAFDDAIKSLDQCKEEHYRDSTLIMQLLRDNLILWQTAHSSTARAQQAGLDE